MPTSVVIPAHNEASVIARSLAALTGSAADGELEIIVVCNGCTDDTAARARAFGPPVRVIETDVPSKSNALNLGDRAASGFPRFYVDADVVLTIDAARRVVRFMQSQGVLAAAPVMRFDLTAANWFVRAYYGVWSKLPYIQEGLVAGAYCLSEEGRGRFDQYPAMTADDAFVRLQFRPHERATVHDCSFLVVSPDHLGTLIRIKTRSSFGNRELRARRPDLLTNGGRGHLKPLLEMAADARNWPGLGVYLFVKTVSAARAYWRYRFGRHDLWERDDSSRRPVPAT